MLFVERIACFVLALFIVFLIRCTVFPVLRMAASISESSRYKTLNLACKGSMIKPVIIPQVMRQL